MGIYLGFEKILQHSSLDIVKVYIDMFNDDLQKKYGILC